MTLKEKVDALLAVRSIGSVSFEFTIRMQDDSDGNGPFVAYLDADVCGAPPTEGDGFTTWEIHKLMEQ